MLSIIAKLIKEKTKAISWKKNNDEKFAKVKTDLKVQRKKAERLQFKIDDLNKEIGRIQNQMHKQSSSFAAKNKSGVS